MQLHLRDCVKRKGSTIYYYEMSKKDGTNNTGPQNNHSEDNQQKPKKMTPEEFKKWVDEENARMLENLNHHFENQKTHKLTVRESLEILRKGILGYSDIPEMDEEEFQRLISKPSATFIRKKNDSNKKDE